LTSNSSYKLCISTFGDTVKSLEARVRQARRLHADLIELRLDYLRNLDISALDAIGKFSNTNEIWTIRSSKEGGKGSTLSEYQRINLIRYAIAHLQPSYFDVEIVTLRRYPDLIKEINRTRTKLIASSHDLKGIKGSADFRKIIFSAPLKNKSLFAVKIVSQAKSLQDNLKVLGLYSSLKQKKAPKLVAFCSGRLGIPSRILCLFLGSPYSYTSLAGEAVAAGQLDIKTMRKIVGTREK
jgi:3-dehydroquinate dehydratase-1